MSIRNLDDKVLERLRVRAAEHGRSMEAEVRAILTEAAGGSTDSIGLAQGLLARFAALGGIDLELPARSERPRGPDLSD